MNVKHSVEVQAMMNKTLKGKQQLKNTLCEILEEYCMEIDINKSSDISNKNKKTVKNMNFIIKRVPIELARDSKNREA